MKTNKLLPIIIAVLVLGVGGYFLMGRKAGGPKKAGSPTVTTEEKTIAERFTGTLKEAVALGVGMKCTYKVEGNEYEGYVKGKNYRGKMKNVNGQAGEVIMKDNCMWAWSEGETQGIKTCFETVDEETGEEIDFWSQQQAAAAADMSYTCIPHPVTDSQFTPPSNIQFMDIDSMMQGAGY